MNRNLHDELMAVATEWDRAMVENDADTIGRYMADDWTIVGSDGSVSRGVSGGTYQGQPFRELERVSCVLVRDERRWRCVLTHLSRLSRSDAP